MNESKETNRVVFTFKREDGKTTTYAMNRARPASEFPWSIAGATGRSLLNNQIFDPNFTGSRLKSLEKMRHVSTVTRDFDLGEV